ncbi:MAG TPA: sugar phosphate isomerase/epimerase family protein [Chitinophagaceae bacterium]|nr:sugar phosphate isomerase/epimerase family protein [Chitinophagaceae bacterium]
MQTSRRDFIKHSALVSAGLMIGPEAFFKTSGKIGLQLYTLRDQLSKDVAGVIAQVAQLGYQEVETFAYANRKQHGMSIAEFDQLLKKNNLQTPSGHYSLRSFLFQDKDDEMKQVIEDAKQLGQQYVVVPYLQAEDRQTLDAYKKLAARLNHGGQMCRDAGMQLAYHNHNFEFQPMDGSTGFDVLLNDTDKSLVQFEMDLYWVSYAGKDPIALMKKNPGRFSLWHVKDMDKTSERHFTEVGNGVIDFKKIFDCKKKAGMQHFFVEQDVSAAPLQSIKTSIDYLKKNLIK